ncbi:hypothetical protein, partial [Tuanshanicoccus lijuaniae]|uniref:hypothetical protein n=1 Tax=Aerococcaceae bacterium zg-1292 TaxID=2774330 RepID=UPI001BD816BA|nr:hypothetical protein [Aerococcaceae bacterium zg-A91]MBS4457412.1 hypothetical protein [Aerococcaceae bacterium zg-BR33]
MINVSNVSLQFPDRKLFDEVGSLTLVKTSCPPQTLSQGFFFALFLSIFSFTYCVHNVHYGIM